MFKPYTPLLRVHHEGAHHTSTETERSPDIRVAYVYLFMHRSPSPYCFLFSAVWNSRNHGRLISGIALFFLSALVVGTAFAQAPPVPTGLTPPDKATGVSINVQLKWNASAGATSYDVVVTTNAHNWNNPEIETTVVDTTLPLSNLSYSKPYYWQVRATNASGQKSNWTERTSFTTETGIPAVPTLLGPPNGDVNVPRDVEFNWSSASGATSYSLEYAKDKNFNKDPVTHDSITGTSYTVRGLAPSTEHYWHVKAKGPGGESDWSDDWTFTTTAGPPPPPPPQPPSLSSPLDRATGVSVNPTLSWSASQGASSYHVQVADKSSFGQNDIKFDDLNAASTSVQVSGLAPKTIYYWRVSAKNSAGAEGAFSSARSFTTLAPPVKPTIQLPRDGETGVSIEPILSWSNLGNGVTYSLQLSEQQNYSNPIVDKDSLTQSSHSVSKLASEKKYFWRVRGSNEAGDGEWAEATFTTVSTKPSPPRLVSPDSNATGVELPVSLNWSTISGATYNVQISESSNFNRIVESGSELRTGTYTATTLEPSKKYYWHASVTTSGGTSVWSETWNFTTINSQLATPTLSKPSDNERDVSQNPTFEWNRVDNALTYHLQVSTDQKFESSFVIDELGITGVSYIASGLQPNTKYFWRVKAANSQTTSAWSSDWSFTTAASQLSAPGLINPSNNARNVSTNTEFEWGAVSGAQTYTLQVSTDRKFPLPLVIGKSGLAGTSFTTTDLLPNTTYYWRVSATDGQTTSEWSSEWSFETATPQIAAPTLVSPSDNATKVSMNPTFEWKPVENAQSYGLQVSEDKNFHSTPMIDTAGIAATSFAGSGLQPNTKYYWRVNANVGQATSEWSEVWMFETGASQLGAPTLLKPDPGAEGVRTTTTFEWSVIPEAITYTFQYTTDRQFRTDIIEVRGITRALYEVSGLLPEKTYYWRVQAHDSISAGEWSDESSFKTGTNQLAKPELVAPEDKETDVVTNPTVVWKEVETALWYTLQYSTDRQFKNDTSTVDSIVNTLYTLKGLQPNTSYFWRVFANDSASRSLSSEEWEFKTGSGRLSSPTLLSPSDRGKDVATTVTFEWSSVPLALWYSLQYSTERDFKSAVTNVDSIDKATYTAWGLSPNTTYYWRVQANDTTGASLWSSEWQFTTGIGRLAKPELESPPDGTSGVPTSATLTWRLSPTATSYAVQVSTEKGNKFSDAIVFDTSGVRGSSVDVTRGLTPLQTYYWRVQASDSSGASDWSDEWKFTTGIGVLSAPIPISPQDGKEGESTTPTLAWEPSANATVYSLQYATDKNFNKELVEINGISKTSFTLSELSTKETYYWRVRAKNATDSSDWSAEWSFTTGSGRLGAPTLLSPADGSEVPLTTNPSLTWSSVPGATGYDVQVSKQRNFGSLVVERTDLTATSLTVTGLDPNERYYWRVRAKTASESSDWSSIWEFSTGTARLLPPELDAPVDGASAVPQSPSLSWKAVSGATSYHVQVALDAQFKQNDIKFEVTSVTTTSITATGLSANKQYFWRVRAFGAAGESDFSPIRSFTTTPVTSVERVDDELPREYYVSQNYPNPFNPSTTIEFAVPRQGRVRIAVFNTLGHLVQTLVDREFSGGVYRTTWEAKGFASGVYFYRIQSTGFVQTKRLVLVK